MPRPEPPPTRVPADFIDTVYLAANPDVAAAVAHGVWTSGAAHWLERGWHEDRPSLPHEPGLAPGVASLPLQPGPETDGFDALGYLHLHPDLTRALGRDLAAARAHWLGFGRFEGRLSPGARPHVCRVPEPGVLLSRPFGLDVHAAFADPGTRGAHARDLVGALLAAGLAVTARGFVPGGHRALRIPRFEQQRPPVHRVSLFLAEPDELVELVSLYPPEAFGGSYVAAAWSTPATAVGPGSHTVFGAIDELWLADAGSVAAYAAIAPVPVRLLPPAAEASAAAAIDARLRELGLDMRPPPFVVGLGRSRGLGAPSLAGHLPDALWRAVAGLRTRPVFHIILSPAPSDATSEHGAGALLERCVAAIAAQAYPFWTLTVLDVALTDDDSRAACETLRGSDPRIRIDRFEVADPLAAMNLAAAAGGATHLLPLRLTRLLKPRALLDFAMALDRAAAAPPPALLYADEEQSDHPDRPGRIVRWPDFAPEQLRAGSCTGDLLVVAHSAWQQLGGLRPEYGDAAGYDLVLRALEAELPIEHVPTLAVRTLEWPSHPGIAASEPALRALRAHAARLGARIEPASPGHVRFRPPAGPVMPVSIVIDAVTGGADLLGLVRTLRQWHAPEAAEIVIVLRTADTPDRTALRALAARIERAPPATATATTGAVRMLALSRTRHPLLLFLDAGARPEEGLLPALLEALHDPAVAAAGTRLLWSPDRHDRPAGLRNVSALSGHCLLLRRAAVDAVHGFDETLTPDPACDADFGLRLRSAGHRLVYTPYASSGPAPTTTAIDQESVQAALAATWRSPTRERLDENRVLRRLIDPPDDTDRPPPEQEPALTMVPLRPAVVPPPTPAVADDRELTTILESLAAATPAAKPSGRRRPTGPLKTRRS